MRAALTGAAALLLVAVTVTGPARAESPSPAPEDRSTTLSVSPTAGPDRTPVVLRGFSDCAVIDGHLLFTTYDGKADNVVVRRTSTTYDYDREKYPFTIRLTVPVTAAPGSAKAYAEPFCGPPEEYPSSPVVPFRVERSSLAVRLSPTRPDSGGRLRIRAGTCDGARGRLTVRVRAGGSTRDVRAAVDATGTAATTVTVTAPGEVSLPFAAAECRGSSYAGAVTYDVRGSTSAAPEPSPTASASPPAQTPSALPSEPGSPPPTTDASATASAEDSTEDGSGRSLVAVAALLVLGTAGAVAAALVRRRRQA